MLSPVVVLPPSPTSEVGYSAPSNLHVSLLFAPVPDETRTSIIKTRLPDSGRDAEGGFRRVASPMPLRRNRNHLTIPWRGWPPVDR